MRKIHNYCASSIMPALCVSIGLILLGTSMLFMTSEENQFELNVTKAIISPLCYILACGAFYNLYLFRNTLFKKQLEKYCSDYTESVMESDFEGSRFFMGGSLKAGKSFLFGKGRGGVIPYSETERIGLRRIQDNMSGNYGQSYAWSVQATAADGSHVEMCRMNRWVEREWREFSDYINTVAPDIIIDNEIKLSSRQAASFERPFVMHP